MLVTVRLLLVFLKTQSICHHFVSAQPAQNPKVDRTKMVTLGTAMVPVETTY